MNNNNIFTAALWFVFLMLSFSINAQKGSFQNVKDGTFFKEKMAEVTISTKTISSDFIQEKHLSFMEEGIISEGQFFYKKDQKIRWEYQKPFNYLVILKGNELLINDEGHINEIDLKNNKTYQQINATISNSLQGNVWQEQNDFSPILMENATHYLIELIPQTPQMKDYLSKIEVFFDKATFQLSKVVMHEPGKDWTKIEFKNRQINTSISDLKFQF